jgi:hypothetical protein
VSNRAANFDLKLSEPGGPQVVFAKGTDTQNGCLVKTFGLDFDRMANAIAIYESSLTVTNSSVIFSV